MGEEDALSIHGAIREVKDSIDDVNKSVNDLRVLVAGNYVTKTECNEKCKAQDKKIGAIKPGWPPWVTAVVSFASVLATYLITNSHAK